MAGDPDMAKSPAGVCTHPRDRGAPGGLDWQTDVELDRDPAGPRLSLLLLVAGTHCGREVFRLQKFTG